MLLAVLVDSSNDVDEAVVHSELGSYRWSNGVDLEYTDAALKESADA